MQFTKVRPTKVGTQFVAVYEYQGRVWSGTYKITTDGLYEYKPSLDSYCWVDETQEEWPFNSTTKYIIL